MRIVFAVNTTGITGGIRVVFEYANRLAARGHAVEIVHVLDLDAGSGTRAAWRTAAKRAKYVLLRPRVGWFDVRVPVRRVPRLEDRWFPAADAVVATAHETAEGVAGLAPSRGAKFYLIQHDEVWGPDPERARATWRLPLQRIVIASWLRELGERRGVAIAAMIPNGVDFSAFHPAGRTWNTPPRILVLAHPEPWKGTADAVTALEALRRAGRRFAVTWFGAHRFDPRLAALGSTVHRPTGERLRALYCAHDIYVSPSWSEGCQLPPMEAMACGTAVVATNVGGVPDYARAGETALVVEPRQPEALAAAVDRLLADPALLRRVAAAGERHIAGFTWERATDALEEVLARHARV